MNEKIDYIITLIGKNPSPSFYTILNYASDNTKVYAFYTDENGGTVSSKTVLENIMKSVEKKNSFIDIVPVECDKSMVKNINKSSEVVFKKILEDCDYDNLGNKNINIIVDYTGATKAMATQFYLFYSKIVKENTYKKLNIHSSYVSSNHGVIYECGFEEPVETKSVYKIEDIFNRYKITKEDLLELHDYFISEEKDDNIIIQNKDVIYNFTKVYIENADLIFEINIIVKKIKEIVDKYFQISDQIEKAGGSETKLIFHVNGYEFENDKFENYDQAKEKFYNSLSNVYHDDLKKKVKIIFESREAK